MHSTKLKPTTEDILFDNEWSFEDQVVFHYNGDYSGNVLIEWWQSEAIKIQEIKIPFWMLAEFVGEAKKAAAIEQLENMSGRDFLHFDVMETL